MPDFSAQHLLPEEMVLLQRQKGQARRFILPTAAAILLHAAVVGPLVWWTNADRAEPQAPGIEIAPIEEMAPAEASEPTEVTEETQAAQPETAPSETPPEAAPPPPPEAVQPPPPDNPPPPPPDAVQPPPPDDAPPPPPDTVEPPPPDTPPPETIAPTPLIEPLAVEPPDSEDVVPPPPPEEAVETPPPPRPPTQVVPDETLRAVAPTPPPPPRPRPRPAAPPQPVQQAAPPAAAAPAPAVAAPPAPVRPPASYVGRLMAALERHKEYPFTARTRRAEGTVVLRFAMRRDGSVASWRIERSSGHEDLDQAVAALIRRASPLPAPPAELPGDPVELVVPVRFSLRN